MSARAAAPSRGISCPITRTPPRSCRTSPIRMRIVVDFPAPLAPMKPRIPPVGSWIFRPSSVKWGYVFTTPSSSTARSDIKLLVLFQPLRGLPQTGAELVGREPEERSDAHDPFEMLRQFLVVEPRAQVGLGRHRRALAVLRHDDSLPLQFDVGTLDRDDARPRPHC